MASRQRVPRSRPAPEARAQILEAARVLFRQRGYERVTLTEIGADMGLTRGAVLYHYRSKSEILTALLDPFVHRLDTLLDQFESAQPPPRPAKVLVEFLDALLDARAAADLMSRDVSGRHALAMDVWVSTQVERIIALLIHPNGSDPAARVRGLAAIGALTRPLATLPDPVPDIQREAILQAAINALRAPRVRAS